MHNVKHTRPSQLKKAISEKIDLASYGAYG